MKPVTGLVASVALITLLAGCEICQAPFDYCNPVVGPGGSLNCDWGARRGSAFHPFRDQPMVGTTAPAPAAVPGATGGQYERTEPSQVEPPQAEPSPSENMPTGALQAEDFPELETEGAFQ